MKEYKYKINGLKFTVNVGDVIDNEVKVEVNGVPYKVELDKALLRSPLSLRAARLPVSPALSLQALPLPSLRRLLQLQL